MGNCAVIGIVLSRGLKRHSLATFTCPYPVVPFRKHRGPWFWVFSLSRALLPCPSFSVFHQPGEVLDSPCEMKCHWAGSLLHLWPQACPWRVGWQPGVGAPHPLACLTAGLLFHARVTQCTRRANSSESKRQVALGLGELGTFRGLGKCPKIAKICAGSKFLF